MGNFLGNNCENEGNAIDYVADCLLDIVIPLPSDEKGQKNQNIFSEKSKRIDLPPDDHIPCRQTKVHTNFQKNLKLYTTGRVDLQGVESPPVCVKATTAKRKQRRKETRFRNRCRVCRFLCQATLRIVLNHYFQKTYKSRLESLPIR